ncbi:hypothetical protein GCM10007049_38350 [Echinicola pacifica]|uniref:Type I phosphodiesterase / nucleotide pyrophosphatase n=1 Tax=Echinicola pacifica TaxID=346377 RepID=A0A918UY38_9BACT|nr:alkaline phosphatase family protein [Echinicola pacifica]GGZ41403.1 hypothetical protein GCM10007049_38350 [Echinicola pacifica]
MKINLLLLGFLLAGLQVFAQQKEKKVLFVIVDGIPADVLDSVATPAIDAIAKLGGITTASMGGDVGEYSQTPTISAVGYNSLLTGVWANKHNVWGNGIKAPNYNYWTIFRYMKEAYPHKKAAIYSTWLDNRTKLVGAGLAETDNFVFDYYYDGFELDTLRFPHDPGREYIFHIDEEVSTEAARHIKAEGPDLSWMYLEFSDDMGHKYGNSPQMVDGLKKADVQIARVWEAIQYREQHFHEEWMLVVTTDHGRTMDGYGHGGQSERERKIWILTNLPETNARFSAKAEMVDILPSMAEFMGLHLPKRYAMELDGVSFLGKLEAADLKASLQEGELRLSWTSYGAGKAKVWMSSTDAFGKSGLDNYFLIGEVDLEDAEAVLPVQDVYTGLVKVVLETPSGFTNYWIVKK